MKKIIATAILVALVGCKHDDKKVEAAATPAGATAPAMTFKDNNEKALYGVAVRMGSQMRQNLEQVKNFGVTANTDLMAKGYKDGLENTAGLKEEEIAAALESFSKDLQQKQQAETQKQLTDNKAKGDEFLAKFDAEAGVTKTASGLRYQVIAQGDGKQKPVIGDTVSVNYRGTLIDGTEFDSSYKRNAPADFVVGQVIPGWNEALQLMSKGAKYKLAIPADIAYGEHAAGSIPAGATLVFEVELLDMKKAVVAKK